MFRSVLIFHAWLKPQLPQHGPLDPHMNAVVAGHMSQNKHPQHPSWYSSG